MQEPARAPCRRARARRLGDDAAAASGRAGRARVLVPQRGRVRGADRGGRVPRARRVRRGSRYGTLARRSTGSQATAGCRVLELETEGALKVQERVPGAVTLFIARRRRRSSSAGCASARPRAPARSRSGSTLARSSSSRPTEFDYVIVNDDVERAADELQAHRRAGARRLQVPWPPMIHPRIDELLDNVDSRYALVIVAAKRARQINNYHHQLGEGIGFERPRRRSSSRARRTT